MNRRFPLLGCLGALALAGCSESSRPVFQPTAPVHGKVVLANGTIVGGGRIELHPEDPLLPEARGIIKTNGTFVLGTYKIDDGVVPGRYTVTIDPIVYDKAGNLRPNRALPIPKKYSDASTSDLKVEIRVEPNEVTWKLSS